MSFIERTLERAAFTRKALEAFYRERGYCQVTLAGQRFDCDPYHRDFWRNAGRGYWEPETFKILSAFLNPQSIYLDIGAWIGPTVLYAARIAKKVVCFEPDYVAYKFLLWNIQLNRLTNVQPFNLALTNRSGMQKLASRWTGLGDSTSSLLNTDGKGEQTEVCCLNWSHWLELSGLARADLVKIDVEGGEFTLLPVMGEFLRKTKPVVYLSLHAHLLPAESRREALQQMIRVLSGYSKCLNESLEPIHSQALAEGDFLKEGKSVVFVP